MLLRRKKGSSTRPAFTPGHEVRHRRVEHPVKHEIGGPSAVSEK